MENANDQQLPIDGTSAVKQEKPEDREIRILADRLMEQQREALAIQQQEYDFQLQETAGTTNVPPNRYNVQAPVIKFGWAELKQIEPGQHGNNLAVIPFLYRHTDKVCSERMLRTMLRDYPPAPITFQCLFQVPKYEILATEVRLLNEINVVHCNGQFGGEFTRDDKVMSLRDALDWYQYRVECHRLLTSFVPGSILKKCGILQIGELPPMAFVVVNGVKHVPAFYICNLQLRFRPKRHALQGWDLAYLKLCCVLQGIDPVLLRADYLAVVSIDEIISQMNNAAVKYFWPPRQKTYPIPDGSRTRVSGLENSQTYGNPT